MTTPEKPIKAVYMIRQNGEQTYWTKIGVAFVNRDGSYNVQLDALPLPDGKLHIRDLPPAKDAP